MSDSDSSESEDDLDEEFDDGLDENMIGDEEDRQRLEMMTEKEREQEIYNRIEKREVLRTRFEIEKKLKLAKKKEQNKKKEKEGDRPKVCLDKCCYTPFHCPICRTDLQSSEPRWPSVQLNIPANSHSVPSKLVQRKLLINLFKYSCNKSLYSILVRMQL